MREREASQQKFQAQLDEWEAKIDQLEAKALKVDAEARLEYEQRIEKLKEMQRNAEGCLQSLHEAGKESWEGLKADFEQTMKLLDDAVNEASSRF